MTAMLGKIFLVLSLLAFINPSLSSAATEQRIALVIGNSAYSSGPLKNPVNDAAAMAAQLQKLGFTVILKKNANLRGMEDALTDFGDRLKRGGVGLFFYAGHGLQVGGANYLVPIGARINRESDIRYEALDAGKILDEMANANNGLNIVILDACRDNPYSRSFRNAARGLAIVSNAPAGTFISYSTSPGNVARDGDGRNSPYTEALLRFMKEPGLTIEQVFKGARAKLGKETGGKQIPWELSSLQGEFYFVPGSGKTATDITPPGKIVIDKDESSTARKSDRDALDDESRQLEDSQKPTHFALAQQAFNEKKFAEPRGENTIEYLRKILINDPENPAALDLEKRAVAAYENEAEFALSRKNEKRALEIYQRLFSLYPEKKQYLNEFVKLETTKFLDISGNWHPEHVSGQVVIYSDGRCIYKGFLVVSIGGKWSCTDPRKRIFSIVWNHGYTDVMTLSADGQKLEGVNDIGDPVSFVRDK